MSNVTIRGIDDEIYRRFSAEARGRGVSIGELATLVMRALVEEAERNDYKIENLDALSISKIDLESLNKPISFSDIKSIVIEDDVNLSIFKKYVVDIRNVDNLTIPSTLPKLLVLTKCNKIKCITISKKVS